MKRYVVIMLIWIAIGIAGCTASDKSLSTLAQVSATHGNAAIKPSSSPVIEIAETEIDLGTIPTDQKEAVGEIRFSNVGSKPLRVQKVTGHCSCFASWSGDNILMPGRRGTIRVVFDKSKLPAGTVRHLVNIETNDPNNKVAKVYFKTNIERDPTEEQIRILHGELSAIRSELSALRNDFAKVLAAVDGNAVEAPNRVERPPDRTSCDVAIGSSPVLGPPYASVTIVEFADFECPYCVREYPKIKQILNEYGDKVKVVFKHFPLNFHKKAKPAHAAAELAKLQGGDRLFWKMHDMIMASPEKLDVNDLRDYAKSLNLDLAKFDEVVANAGKTDDLLSMDLTEANKCNVHATPTVFINGIKLKDRSINGYRTRINDILAEQK